MRRRRSLGLEWDGVGWKTDRQGRLPNDVVKKDKKKQRDKKERQKEEQENKKGMTGFYIACVLVRVSYEAKRGRESGAVSAVDTAKPRHKMH